MALRHSRLLEVLSYDRATGVFIWAQNPNSGPPRKGEIAGCLRPNGYIEIGIDGNYYQAHRLAWFYCNGFWPNGYLDHKDLNKKNNRIINLREATFSQNRSNTRAMRDNTSGLKGVVWHKRDKKWQAQISADGRQRHLGLFDTKQAAHEAYCIAAVKYHGQFARFK